VSTRKCLPYQIVVVNSILDNVHGFIGLTELENRIERLPVFKRLQNISQLGLTNRIFPCALHNRYIHSLGVMYIVDQMAVKLKFDPDERQIIRLAAMLHDIGHYPFSHDVESAYIDAKKVVTHDAENELFTYANNAHEKIKNLSAKSNELKFFMHGTDNIYHHESIGTVVIQNSAEIKKAILECYVDNNPMYKNVDNKIEAVDEIIADISAIITGNAQHQSKYFGENFSAMVQIMHSELDADRIDYLLRDATFSGASYGNFDVGMLIQNLRTGIDPVSKEVIVGVTKKGIGCAEQFLLSRYFAYNQVIYHKYTSVLGCALQSIVRWMIEDDSSAFPYKNIINVAERHESDTRFYSFTDAYLINAINDIDPGKSPCPQPIYSLVKCLKNYQALEMEEEVICSGISPEKVANHIETSKLYLELEKTLATPEVAKEIKKVYQYREMRITKHLPEELFEALLDDSIKSEAIEADMADSYRVDRLQDGLAIIGPDGKPSMLIDSTRSMLHDIYTLRYCVLRTYAV